MILTLIYSCNEKSGNSTSKTQSKEISIDIRNASNKSSSIFKKIELVQLETTEASIFNNVSKAKYIDDKYFIIVDRDNIVTVFDTKGAFIANSRKRTGPGPNEYYTLLDVTYNKYTNKFDLLEYDNAIFSYDTQFNFLSKVKIKRKNVKRFSRFVPIGKSSYILTPTPFEETDKIYFYDTKNEEMDIVKFEGNVSKVNSQPCPFTAINSDLFFSPSSFNYSLFSIDIKNKALHSVFNLNIIHDKFNEKELSNYNPDQQVDYLLNRSNSVIPLRNLISTKYIVSVLLKNQVEYTNIYNRETKTNSIIVSSKSDFIMPDFFAIKDDILYALVYPYNTKKYIDIKLLDSKNMKVLNNTNEELNPLIVKYYLK